MNPYLELGISPTASLEELKRAYRRAVLRYHPDTASGHGDPEKFNAVLQAYHLLKGKYERRSHAAEQATTRHAETPLRQAYSAEVQLDSVTMQMPLHQLAYCLETSTNPYVRLTAIEAIALKGQFSGISYLTGLLAQSDPTTQRQILRALGRPQAHYATPTLFHWIQNPEAELALEAVKSLEKINPSHRAKVIEALKLEHHSFWQEWVAPLRKTWEHLTSDQQSPKLGELLIERHQLSPEQLELALLLQKQVNWRLGQILAKLEYLSPAELQQALALQQHGQARF